MGNINFINCFENCPRQFRDTLYGFRFCKICFNSKFLEIAWSQLFRLGFTANLHCHIWGQFWIIDRADKIIEWCKSNVLTGDQGAFLVGEREVLTMRIVIFYQNVQLLVLICAYWARHPREEIPYLPRHERRFSPAHLQGRGERLLRQP